MQQFRFPGGLRPLKENWLGLDKISCKLGFLRSSLLIFVQREDLDVSSTIPC